ncbi:hypothetical protein HN51_070360, partial [Arachis hypogaea]
MNLGNSFERTRYACINATTLALAGGAVIPMHDLKTSVPDTLIAPLYLKTVLETFDVTVGILPPKLDKVTLLQ